MAALRFTRQSPLFEIPLVLVRFDHVASVIVNADQEPDVTVVKYSLTCQTFFKFRLQFFRGCSSFIHRCNNVRRDKNDEFGSGLGFRCIRVNPSILGYV